MNLNDEYSLYILLVENNRIIVHLSKKNIDNNLLLQECSILYYSIKKFEILDKIQIESFFEIDMYVKKYMKEYGIENVIGGTYSNKFLDEKDREYIKKELSIESKINNSLNISKSILNNSIIDDLEWLLEFIKNKEINITDNYLNNYKNILKKLDYYIPQIEESFSENKELNVLIKKPIFIYDNFFYHRKTLLNKKNYKHIVETGQKLTLFYIEYCKNKFYSS